LQSEQNIRGLLVAAAAVIDLSRQTRRPPLLLSIDGTDRRRYRRTDERTLDRFMTLAAYYADRVTHVCSA